MQFKRIVEQMARGHVKGLPAIRVFLFAMPILAMLFVFSLLFVVSYDNSNQITANTVLQNQYASLNGSVVGQNSILGQLNNLANATNSTQSQIQAGGFDIFGAFRIVYAMLVFMFGFYFNLASFVAIPLIWIGIPASYATLMTEILITLVPVLVIVSAYFLKDV